MKNYSKVDSGKRTEERQYVIPAELVLAKAGSRNPDCPRESGEQESRKKN